MFSFPTWYYYVSVEDTRLAAVEEFWADNKSREIIPRYVDYFSDTFRVWGVATFYTWSVIIIQVLMLKRSYFRSVHARILVVVVYSC